jgi:hypothetical protein
VKKFTWKLPKDSIHVGGVKTAGIGVISPKDLKIEFTKNY